MTPREKAIEIYEKFYYSIENTHLTALEVDKQTMKCCKVCIDEILNCITTVWDKWDIPIVYDQFQYWQKVKEKLEKL